MTTYKVESKREEFRKYLEKNGVLEALTKCLVSLYEEPERPADPLDYVRRSMAATSQERVELEGLRVTVAELRDKVSVMERDNGDLVEKLAALGVSDIQDATAAAADNAAASSALVDGDADAPAALTADDTPS